MGIMFILQIFLSSVNDSVEPIFTTWINFGLAKNYRVVDISPIRIVIWFHLLPLDLLTISE